MTQLLVIHRVWVIYTEWDWPYILEMILHRRIDPESRNIECIWIQFKLGNQKILLGQIYRHPSFTNVWFDDFSDMMDSVYY